MMYLSPSSSGLNAEFVDLIYDENEHLEAITRSELSLETRARLAQFFPAASA